jgi:glyoxylase-like metal-dependent hydrolase (beta-lactamase superfamily II)
MQVFERGWLSSNSILFFDSDGGATLVDTGYCSHAKQTVALVQAALTRAGAGTGRKLTRIINTHLHSDHCGGNAALAAAFPNVEILIPEAEADVVATWDEARLSYRATGQQCPRFTRSTLCSGDVLQLGGQAWKVYAAPGHDPHSLILFQSDSRCLISADALWQDGFGVIFPELAGESGFEPARATLELIAGLAPAKLIPGHGEPFEDCDAALKRAFSRLAYLGADPARNAQHALKVLLKFYLLQVQRTPRAALVQWALELPYMAVIQQRYFATHSLHAMAEQALAALLRAGAAKLDGEAWISDAP